MIRDKQTELSSQQSLISAAATVNSTNVYDTGVAGGDAGVGEPLYFALDVDTAFAGASGTLSVQLQTSDDEAFGSGNVTVFQTDAIAAATLVPGYQVKARLPFGLKRYVRAQYVIAGASGMTAGEVTAGIVTDVDNQKQYPSGWSF